MLGKQCWNLISRPDALVSRVLKARYYPNCHLLHADRKGGSSYTWSGIWEAKEEVKKGLRWVLGDGQTINMSSDRWLRGKEGYCINNDASHTTNMKSKVCEFFKDDRKSWDENKVRLHFNTEDAEAILNTRIPQVCTRDKIAWVHLSDGQYTVKTGYQQWYRSHVGDAGLQHSKGWNKIWNLEIPHRIKVFLWRFCRNNVSVRILLRGRGIAVPVGCAMCVGEVEHLCHLFFDCNFVKTCWQYVGVVYDMWEVEYVSEWLLNMLSTKSNVNLVRIAAVLWGVWFARNQRVFEGRTMSPAATMDWSTKQIKEWAVVNKRMKQTFPILEANTHMHKTKWERPDLGALKINVDASVFDGEDSFSVGLVLKDHQGQYITGKVLRFTGCVPMVEAEMVGILEALTWIKEIPVTNIIVESDSLVGVNAINNNRCNYLELGDLIASCRDILRNRDGVLVRYIRKRTNRVAHSLARIPCELNSFIIMSSPLLSLLETILSDVLIV